MFTRLVAGRTLDLVRGGAALVLATLLAGPAAAEVTIRVSPATVPPGSKAGVQVDLTARAAPLAEVLDRLARQIGMKIVYEGAAPRQLVSLTLQGRSPAEAVLGLLEGQGLNFALVGDPTGMRVETLLVAGLAPASSPSPSSGAGHAVFAPAMRRPTGPPPGSGPDTVEPDEEEEPLEDTAGLPIESESAPPQVDPGQLNPQVPTPRAPGPVTPENQAPPGAGFSGSPFAPQPQPFPPLPPGVPAVTTPPPADQPATPPPGN
jgi:hypothetical protein